MNDSSNDDAKEGKPTSGGWAERMLSVAPLVVTLVAAYYYFIARSSYVQFYGVFGVSPEEVGLGYAETLTRSATALVYSLVMGLVLVQLVFIFVLFRRGRVVTIFGARSAYGRAGLIGLIAAITLLAFSVLLLTSAAILRGRVQDGESVRAKTELVGLQGWATVLGVGAEAVTLDWIEGDPPTSVRESQEHRLMYLGRSGSTLVLYDVDAKRTLRLPEGSVVLTQPH